MPAFKAVSHPSQTYGNPTLSNLLLNASHKLKDIFPHSRRILSKTSHLPSKSRIATHDPELAESGIMQWIPWRSISLCVQDEGESAQVEGITSGGSALTEESTTAGTLFLWRSLTKELTLAKLFH